MTVEADAQGGLRTSGVGREAFGQAVICICSGSPQPNCHVLTDFLHNSDGPLTTQQTI